MGSEMVLLQVPVVLVEEIFLGLEVELRVVHEEVEQGGDESTALVLVLLFADVPQLIDGIDDLK